ASLLSSFHIQPHRLCSSANQTISPSNLFSTPWCVVWFSGFEENGDRIQINTDLLSRKLSLALFRVMIFCISLQIQELKQCQFSEMCWYFSDTWEQLQNNGRAEVIDASNFDQTKLQLRGKAWFTNSLKSSLMYICHAPGSPYNSEQPNQEVRSDSSSGPVANFCLLFLEAKKRLLFSSMINGTGEKCWTSKKIT
ncbi:hypothetical protein HID58_029740, partial [Brassica napus]